MASTRTALQDLLRTIDGKGDYTALVDLITADRDVSGLIGIATKYYELENVRQAPQLAADKLLLWKSSLFSLEPLAVLYGLVQNGLDLALGDSTLRQFVADLLKELLVSGFDIQQSSVLTTLQDESKILPTITEPNRTTVLECIKTIQRLLALVADPEHLTPLMKAGYSSARQIVFAQRPKFRKDTGLTGVVATSICDKADIVYMRNEQTWAYFLKSRSDSMFPAIKPPEDKSGDIIGRDPSKLLTQDTSTLANLCRELEAPEGDECLSVLSPAAYFADILKLLGEKKTIKGPTMLDFLQGRRPDLVNIELSCANTKSLVPYLDIANEIMASFIALNLKNGTEVEIPFTLAVINAPSENSYVGEGDDRINPTTYRPQIESIVFPLTSFPYNFALDEMRLLLQHQDTSRYELLTVFQPHSGHKSLENVDRVLNDLEVNKSRSSLLADRATRTAIAAEYLGLNLEEFVAITHGAFQSHEYVRTLPSVSAAMTAEEYEKWIGRKFTKEDKGSGIKGNMGGAYWGYNTDADMLDYTTGTGLSFIKTQFLPRSGISVTELLELLNTQFIGCRLVITSSDGSPRIKDSLEDMRLRSSILVNKTGELTVDLCDQVQAFLRLWKKLGWSIYETDAALHCVMKMSETSSRNINEDIIEELAAIKQLSVLTGLNISQLLPLWDNIYTSGPTSLYHQLFFRPDLRHIPGMQNFTSSDGRYLPTKLSKSDGVVPKKIFEVPLAAVFQVSEEDLQRLLAYAGLTRDSELTLENVSSVYRILEACKIFKIPVELYSALLSVFQPEFKFYHGPLAAVSIYRQWSAVVEFKCTLPLLNHLVHGVVPPTDKDLVTRSLGLAKSIARGKISTAEVSPLYRNGNDPLVEDISRAALLLFSEEVADGIIALIEGKLCADAKAARLVGSFLCSRYLAATEDSTKILDWLVEEPDTEAKVLSRRTWFLKNVNPELQKRNQFQSLLDTVLAAFGSSGVDDSIIQTILTNLIFIDATDGEGNKVKQSATQFLFSATLPSESVTQPPQDIFFFPTKSAKYVMSLPGTKDKKPTVSLNGELLVFKYYDTLHVWAKEVDCLADGSYRIVSSSPSEIISIKVSTDVIPRQFTPQEILDGTVVDKIVWIYGEVERILLLVQTFALTTEEFGFLTRSPIPEEDSALNINICALSMDLMSRLACYASLRVDLGKNSSDGNHVSRLISFLKWISQAGAVKKDMIVEHLSKLTNYAAPEISSIVDAKYPGLEGNQLRDVFQGEYGISDLIRILRYLKRINIPPANIGKVFTWAKPLSPRQPDTTAQSIADEQEIVTTLTKSMLSSTGAPKMSLVNARNEFRRNKRKVLVEYLLNHKFFKDKNCKDSDSLFEFFLIDVNMGEKIQTSRLKQAISTVQLFVQRYFLGMETGCELTPANTEELQSKWEWMGRYTLWEANRKVFLYPENWLDPTLRDNKTELFKEFESSIMQSNVNDSVVNEAIRKYIYSANEVANLDIQSYLWEKDDNKSGRFHFFSRTRSEPFQFYYRKMELKTYGIDRYPYWSPWTKLGVHVPPQNIDSVSQTPGAKKSSGSYLIPALARGRLYLFVPQFLLHTQKPVAKPAGASKPTSLETKIDEASTNTPPKYWELKMGVSEYRNGSWSATKIPDESLIIKAADKQPLVAASAFRFRVGGRIPGSNAIQSANYGFGVDGNLLIAVDTVGDSQVMNEGVFELRGGELVLCKGSYMEVAPNILHSSFSKLKETATPTEKGLLLLSPLPKDQTSEPNWTMSFDSSNYKTPTGLVVDVLTKERGRLSFFTWPPTSDHFGTDTNAPITNRAITTPLDHSLSSFLMEAATQSGNNLASVFKTFQKVPNGQSSDSVFGSYYTIYHEEFKPFSLYNWELGVHAVSLLMERFLATQQFDLALKIARYLFDPTIVGKEPNRCWLFAPFADKQITIRESEELISGLKRDETNMVRTLMDIAVHEWRDNPFNPHAVARARPISYMKRVVMKYIEILIARGDEYFRQQSLETIPFAIQHYIEASHVFGARPQQVPRLTKPVIKTFAQLQGKLNEFSNLTFDFELEFPFSCKGVSVEAQVPKQGLPGFLRTAYFCVPPNPEIMKLRNMIDDRLYKIRNSLDLDGNPLSLPLFDPPIDPGMLVRAVAGGFKPSQVLRDLESPMPNYRFVFLLHKALWMCSELKSLGEIFLQAIEKKDVEALFALQNNTAAQQDLVLKIKTHHQDETQKSIDALLELRKSYVHRLEYYLELIGEKPQAPKEDEDWVNIKQVIEKPSDGDLRITPSEQKEMDLTAASTTILQIAGTLKAGGAALKATPNVTEAAEPMGVGVTLRWDATKVGKYLAASADATSVLSLLLEHQAKRVERRGQLAQQLQERRLQANLAGLEIKYVDKQIATEKAKKAAADEEVKLQEQVIKDAKATSDWYRNKYTNEQLYTWIENETRKNFYASYQLTSDLAKKVEKAFQFERGTSETFLSTLGYWDGGRDGLLSSQRLYLDLKRLENAHMERSPHDFQISKIISLKRLDPLQLLALRGTGTAQYSLPEVLFDLDFPGHYLRRIRSVAITIASGASEYTSLNCTLTLLQHKYRISAIPGGVNQFRTDRVPIASIAVSTGKEDSGVFELDFKDERYLPFEGAGVISTWKLELPSEFRQFDYNTISDVVMHMKYTSRNSGGSLALQALEDVKSYFKGLKKQAGEGIYAFFDLKTDFAGEWRKAVAAQGSPPGGIKLTLTGLAEQLPFWTRGSGRSVFAEDVFLVLENADKDVRVTVKGPRDITTAPVVLEASTTISQNGCVVQEKLGCKLPVGNWSMEMTPVAAAEIVNAVLVFKYILELPVK